MAKIVYKGKTEKGLEVLVRYPQKSDLQQLTDYINTLSKEKTFIIYQGEQKTLKQEKKFLDDVLKSIKKRQGVFLIAFVEKKIAGATDIRVNDKKIWKHVGELGLSVAKEYRKQGIGKLLIKTVLDEAKNKIPGLKIINLGVFSINIPAQNLYKKLGFIEYGRLPKAFLYKGKYEDDILMYKNV